MIRHLPVLHSKLSLPNIAGTLPRPRLHKVLQAITRKKLALVIAGAGFGKTTLVAQTIAALPVKAVWYYLDETDRELATFWRYLLTGIRKYEAEFGQGLTTALVAPSLAAPPRETILLEFLAEAEKRFTSDMVIVLDDYHKIQEQHEITQSIDFILARLPAKLHVIMVSRAEPQLQVSLERSRGQVIELAEQDLSFRQEEIQHFFRACLEVDINAFQAANLLQKTGGWGAGLILCYHAWQKNPEMGPDFLGGAGLAHQFLHQYLEENIFAHQSAEIKNFLLPTSLLDHLEPELCDLILEKQSARRILADLAARHLFTFPYGDGGEHYRYHHLFQEFLRAKLERDWPPQEVARLHHAFGLALEARRDIPGALRHFLAGRHYPDLARLLSTMAFQDFLDCSLGVLRQALDQIPAQMIAGEARLLYVSAKLASLAGDLQPAITGLQDSLAQFQQDGNDAGAAACSKDLAFHYYLSGDMDRAHEQMTRLKGRSHPDPFFPAEVEGYLILFASLLGRTSEADATYDAARAALLSASEPLRRLISPWLDLCYSNRYYLAGDFEPAMDLTLKAMAAFTAGGLEAFLPLANFQASLISYYQVRPQTGLGYAAAGLALAEKLGIFDHQYAWLLYGKALNAFGRAEIDQSLREVRASLALFARQGNAWGQASVYELLGMIHQQAQQWSEAERCLENGRRFLANTRLPVARGSLALRQVELNLERSDYQGGLQVLAQHEEKLAASNFLGFCRHLLAARAWAALGRMEPAVSALEAGLALSQKYSYAPWLRRESARLEPVLSCCLARGIMPEYLKEIFPEAGSDSQAGASICCSTQNRQSVPKISAMFQSNVRPAPLRIRCLGSFSVTVGSRAIPAKEWRRNKAARIFKYLALKGQQEFLPRDLLLEALWPREDPAVTGKRLHVALSWLRRLLEPDREQGLPSAYIIRQNEAYRLELGPGGNIDFLEFLQAVEQAEKLSAPDIGAALWQYLQAEALYGGPLLASDPYDECFAPERERLQNAYLKVLTRIIEIYEQQENWREGLAYAEKFLSVDPYAEAMYGVLMGFQARLGERGRLVRTFEQYRARLADDLGCPLSAEIIDLYQGLMGKIEV